MSERLDDLARTLAQPMPRGRALGVLGVTLVGLATGGSAAGARKPLGTQQSCGNGFKVCTPGSDRCRSTCCPTHTTCSFGPKDPKNGCAISDGCCDPCNPRESTPNGTGGCKPGPVADDCGPKTCGPDITNELEDALSRVKDSFAGWSTVRRYDACIGLVTLPGAAISWDVKELGPGGRENFTKQYPGCGTCGSSVQIGGGCHYSGSANYVVYGVMMRLCHDYLSKEESAIADWFSKDEMLELIYIHKNQTGTQAANFQASNEWALAGYQSGSVRPTPRGDRPNCGSCPKRYSGPGLTVRWLPNVIRPSR